MGIPASFIILIASSACFLTDFFGWQVKWIVLSEFSMSATDMGFFVIVLMHLSEMNDATSLNIVAKVISRSLSLTWKSP